MDEQEFDEEFVKSWIKALRSGEYEQGTNSLKYDNKFCCLGVACDLDDEVEWDGRVAVLGGSRDSRLLPIQLGKKIGADEVAKYRNILISKELIVKHTDISGSIFGRVPREKINITALNDNETFTFEDIASILEEHFFGEDNG